MLNRFIMTAVAVAANGGSDRQATVAAKAFYIFESL